MKTYTVCSLLIGIVLILYSYIGPMRQMFLHERQIIDYELSVSKMDELDITSSFNSSCAYPDLLDPCGTGMMGYLEIPVIDLKVPVFHGTSDDVLLSGIGHLKWSDLPVGGENTHSVLVGHSGLPSARLFSDLHQMVPGDQFSVYVLNRVLQYEVVQISVVTPDDISKLQAEPGEDLVTLVTCTPVGVNSHRLLVRGHRVS